MNRKSNTYTLPATLLLRFGQVLETRAPDLFFPTDRPYPGASHQPPLSTSFSKNFWDSFCKGDMWPQFLGNFLAPKNVRQTNQCSTIMDNYEDNTNQVTHWNSWPVLHNQLISSTLWEVSWNWNQVIWVFLWKSEASNLDVSFYELTRHVY